VTVYMTTYHAVSILHGGPRTQITETARHLESSGVQVRFFDPWTPFRPESGDLVHLFAANIGTYHIAREFHALGVPLVVSPITYTSHSAAFVRRALAASRMLQKAGPGIWSDYALCADICSWAKRVVPNTQAEADLIVQGYGIPVESVRVVPNGVDERFASGDPDLFRKKYSLDNFILNVGHIGHARKNVLKLIRALGAIDHPAVIIGRIIAGPYGEACVREAAKFRNIRLIDGLGNDSAMLASAYAACSVFALPSLFETPGIAALEAGLAGAKIVITPHGGTKEYFGDMATYVDPGDEGSIRSGILAALDTRRDTLLREHIAGHFLWKHVAGKTKEVYEELEIKS
jgi:glycosyltransferase involved in cell wall biosynthesis